MSNRLTEFFDESAFPPPENKYEHYSCECVEYLAPDSFSFTCWSADVFLEYISGYEDYDGDFDTHDTIRDDTRFVLNGTPISVTRGHTANEYRVLKCDELTCVATGETYTLLGSPSGTRPFELSTIGFSATHDPDHMGHVRCVGWYADAVEGKVPFFESADATKASLAIGIVALVLAFVAFVTSVCGRRTPTYITPKHPVHPI